MSALSPQRGHAYRCPVEMAGASLDLSTMSAVIENVSGQWASPTEDQVLKRQPHAITTGTGVDESTSMRLRAVFLQREVRSLGHVLNAEGLCVDAQCVQDILEMPTPKNSSQRSLRDLLAANSDDETLVKLREYWITTWPLHRLEVPEPLRTYWPYRDEIHAQGGLIFRSNKLIVPQSKISEMSLLHAAKDVGEGKERDVLAQYFEQHQAAL
ncbi:hypothetical protein HPB49_020390 [Dermacentor silvarum]|uniref:Uncharacterized protein n=1 Tax=Dermacentor silvarum TaxID=543639 RepID=A0ACB8DFH4_DERSI|nr:hypothetical protein HPB49_020390 [Dermacentor silvarum]